MSHLPDTSENEDDGLAQRPPQDTSVGAFAGCPETFFTQLQKITIKLTRDHPALS